MRLAEELGMPLVTVIDTPGAALSKSAEEGGLAAEIARSLAALVTLQAPTVSVLLGQGSGGGSLAPPVSPGTGGSASRRGDLWRVPDPAQGGARLGPGLASA